MQRLCAEHHLPVSLLPDESKYIAASSLHVHAEMQILVSLAQNADWHGRAHSYIGVSKKLCFLCDQVSQNYDSRVEEGARGPTFKARPCHGKVYSLWTLPLCEDLPSSSKRSLARSVTSAHARMRQKLPHKLQLQPAIAESSAGVTITGSTASVALLRDQHVKDHRPLASPNISNEGERPSALGRKIKTVRVGCLPANISDPDVVSIAFHDLSKTPGVKTFESGKEYVPDFREAWDAYQFDRRYRDITLGEQAREDWNGEYRLYWNENPKLPHNQTIKSILNIEGEVETMRCFWYGDVFLVRYSEHPETFDFDVYDLPFTIADLRVFLEKLLEG